jgi:nitroimidazol reductase NimA-like FMN-containing flavoprotein (pyridoxamine 5'-phosphate oxidase superfamily)
MSQPIKKTNLEATDRTTLKRQASRGSYDRVTINAILDEGFVCHVAASIDGKPYALPTAYARQGDRIIVHGSSSNRMLRALAAGAEVCVNVALVDGLVLARSAFHHSVNYRCVILYGQAVELVDFEEKRRALRDVVEHIVPGRSAEVREPNEAEIKMTLLLAIPIEEASAKIRVGPPIDDEADYEIPAWAGVLPLPVVPGVPERCPRLAEGITLPDSLRAYRR